MYREMDEHKRFVDKSWLKSFSSENTLRRSLTTAGTKRKKKKIISAYLNIK